MVFQINNKENNTAYTRLGKKLELENKSGLAKNILIQTVPANVEGRDFVIGDLHGCFDELELLLNHVNFDPKIDRVFSTGDLIDRGPYSLECLRLLEKPWFYSCLGNHEDILIKKAELIKSNQATNLGKDEIEYIESLMPVLPLIDQMPLILEIEHLIFDKFYLVHAEILPEHFLDTENKSYEMPEYLYVMEAMRREDFGDYFDKFFSRYKTRGDLQYALKQKLIWSRKMITYFYDIHKDAIQKQNFSFLKDEKAQNHIKIFCGHNIVPFPMKISQQYYIDTGAALGYNDNMKTLDIFTRFGHEFFGLTMIEVATGLTYNCVTSESKRGEIVVLPKPIYEI